MLMVETQYTEEQIIAWLRGLLTVAWADGHYDPQEKEAIAEITKELATSRQTELLEPISAVELAAALTPELGENFLRTAVMVAVADGVYSEPEADILEQFSEALGLQVEALEALKHTIYKPQTAETESVASAGITQAEPHPALLQPVRNWLDRVEIDDPRLARFVCKMVPSQCPFERDIKLFGHKVVHIPPLCKLNPLYEQLVGLRFRSLSYLADQCNEDVSEYI